MATTDPEGDRIPLMLIHGAWLSARSWESFADYFDKRGFAVSAPEWPRKHGDVEQLREQRRRARGPRSGRDRRPLRAADPRARRPPGPDRALLRRPDRRAAARPRSRPRRRGAQPGAAEGHPRPAVLVAEGRVARAGAPVEAARDRHADARGVHVRVREHVRARGGRRGVRALRRPRDRSDLLRGRVRELRAAPAHASALQERAARAAADRRRGRGPHRAGLGLPSAVQEVRALARRQTEYLEFEGRPHLFMVGEGSDEVAAAIDSWLDGVLDAAPAPAGG